MIAYKLKIILEGVPETDMYFHEKKTAESVHDLIRNVIKPEHKDKLKFKADEIEIITHIEAINQICTAWDIDDEKKREIIKYINDGKD